MATEKVGIYRSYYGPIPTDESGQPLPSSEWPKKREHSWVVRWFGADGNRYSKSFKNRKEADRFAESKQSEVREGKADPPDKISLDDFAKEHERFMRHQVAPETLYDQMRALRMFMQHIGNDIYVQNVKPKDAESFVAARLDSGAKVATVNKDIRTLKRVFNLAIDPRGYLLPGQNPFGRIKQRKLCPKGIRYVKPKEFRAVVEAASSTWWKCLLSVAYTTGPGSRRSST